MHSSTWSNMHLLSALRLQCTALGARKATQLNPPNDDPAYLIIGPGTDPLKVHTGYLCDCPTMASSLRRTHRSHAYIQTCLISGHTYYGTFMAMQWMRTVRVPALL